MLRRIYKSIANLCSPIDITTNLDKWEFKNKILRLARLNIGRHVIVGPNFQCITGLEENIKIDDYVALGHNVKFYSFSPIKIGSFTLIAADVSITNGGHDTNNFEPFSKEAVIGRGCWIGHGARIVKPVTIGDNVIISAGAIVTKDIPDNAIAVGVPAKVVKFRELPEKVWFSGNHYFDPKTFQLIS